MALETYAMREYPLSADAERLIAERLFGSSSIHHLGPYFRYYTSQCRQVTSMDVTGGAHEFPLKTNEEIMEIITDIRRRASHEDIVERLIQKCGASVPTDLFQNSIDLGLRILLMLDVGTFQNAYSGRENLTWKTGTVDEFIRRVPLFEGIPVGPCDGVKLENGFNARNIERIAGFNVRLTTNLADHLLLREDLRTLSIFNHAAFLRTHQEQINTIFPDGFVDETLHTLALLFPKGDKDVEKWYKTKANNGIEELDFICLKCNSNPAVRRIDTYRFWRDRLVQLKEAFDESRPRTVTQWWHDRRDGIQWYSLWIAIFLTIFFGLIQSIEGAIQVYKTYHPE